jgi:hypothetical protein
MKFFDTLTTELRETNAALDLLALMRKTLEKYSDPDSPHLADLRKVASAGLPASMRTTWRGDGTVCLEFTLADQTYIEPMILPNGHSTPLAFMAFSAFIAGWGEAADVHARQLKTAS